MEPTFKTIQGDCLEVMRTIEDESIDLVLSDPPYNISVRGEEWDNLGAGYTDWMIDWILEAQRVLKPNGVLYIWHSDMPQIARILVAIEQRTDFVLKSFCVWDKGQFRCRSWKNRDPQSATAPRSWFNVCEYCMHFFKSPKENDAAWMAARPDKNLLGGGSSQDEEEAARALRNYHRCDPNHSNVWRLPTLPSNNRLHICQKPDSMLARMIRVSCRPGGTVLDPFMGSGSTGVACAHEHRSFVGIERDDRFFAPATQRIKAAYDQGILPLFE